MVFLCKRGREQESLTEYKEEGIMGSLIFSYITFTSSPLPSSLLSGPAGDIGHVF